MDFTHELDVALAAAALASDYARREYEAFTPIPDAHASISTHVDREAQEIILKHLHAAFPNDRLIGEEATESLASSPLHSDRAWVVDPIDGTRGFVMKNGEFSIMIGFTVRSRPVVGVVVEPVLNRVTYAATGGGCRVRTGDGEPVLCRVTTVNQMSEATLIQSRSKPGKPPKPVVTALQPKAIRETYSAGIKLAMVARGEGEMYVNDYTGFHDWDICAGHVLVEEAGGRVSLFNGEPIEYGTANPSARRGMVATNGLLHEQILERLRGI